MAGETQKLFTSQLRVINVGVDSFAEAVSKQDVKVEQVDWRPPADGDEEMARLLDRLGGV